MIQLVRGDLLTAFADDVYAICHQVNCRNVMGAGIAKQIRDRWPVVEEKYHKLMNTVDDAHSLLGTIQTVKVGSGKYVVNIFGQYDYGRDGNVYTDYTALNRAFIELNERCGGGTIAFPHGFGCGLAGGDWMDVEKIMAHRLTDCDVKIYMR